MRNKVPLPLPDSAPGDRSRQILLFGGTTEGRLMAQDLAARSFKVTVCVATQTGMQYLEGIPGLQIRTGRMDTEQILSLIREGFCCCIDATHPYAVEVTAAVRAACRKAQLPYFRLLRKKLTEKALREKVAALADEYRMRHTERTQPGREGDLPEMLSCGSAREACALLLEMNPAEGRVLLTTGAKEAGCFTPLADHRRERILLRTLPDEISVRKCMEAGFLKENILTGRGPYTVEENLQVMQAHRIRFLVTKDGGVEGGYPEKLAAAWLCGAKVILIRRPREDGMNAEEILKRLCSDPGTGTPG